MKNQLVRMIVGVLFIFAHLGSIGYLIDSYINFNQVGESMFFAIMLIIEGIVSGFMLWQAYYSKYVNNLTNDSKKQ